MNGIDRILIGLGYNYIVPRVDAIEAVQAIAKLEQALGVELPIEYREFVVKYGGIAFDCDAEFPISGPCGLGNSDDIEIMYSLRPTQGYNLQDNLQAYASDLPDGFLPIGQDAFGNLLCLAVVGEKRGWVYFWNQDGAEGDEHRDFPGFGDICPVASGFNKFICSLRGSPKT